MAKCEGTTRAGHQCTNQPKENGYCGHHQPKSVEPTPPPVDNGFRFEFMDIAREVRDELRDLDIQPNTRPQYWNLVITCVTKAKEEQRLLDGLGAGTTHVIKVVVPSDKPKPPVEDEPPVKAVRDSEGEKVMN